jgi:uncharacterized protein (DUF1800 family)
MLIYLDNAQSVALPERRQQQPGKAFRGLNENYARELLELHTLGVDGGYSQTDVRELARVLTGWGVAATRPGELVFAFHARKHDSETKRLLGQQIAADAQAEGEAVLQRLARHASTARHLATKLCRRFVADDPPAQCTAEVARAFHDSDGDIGQTLRVLLHAPTFWADEVRGQKFKSPVEFVVSAARALGARPDGSDKLARHVDLMGEGLFLYPPPTGYPEVQDAWLSSGALLARLELATEIARGGAAGLTRAAGLTPNEAPSDAEDDQLLASCEQQVLGQPARAVTHDAIAAELATLPRRRQRRLLALALLVGSPEFQRQ